MLGDNPDPEPGGWRGWPRHAQHRKVALIVDNPAGPRRSRPSVASVQPAQRGGPAAAGRTPRRRPRQPLRAWRRKLAHLTGTTKFKLTPDQQKELQGVRRRRRHADRGRGRRVERVRRLGRDRAGRHLRRRRRATSAPILPPSHVAIPLAGRQDRPLRLPRVRPRADHRPAQRPPRPRDRAGRPGRRSSTAARTSAPGSSASTVDGILGYSPETATDIMRNVVLYAAAGGRPPPPPPKPAAPAAPATQPASKPAAPAAAPAAPAPVPPVAPAPAAPAPAAPVAPAPAAPAPAAPSPAAPAPAAPAPVVPAPAAPGAPAPAK